MNHKVKINVLGHIYLVLTQPETAAATGALWDLEFDNPDKPKVSGFFPRDAHPMPTIGYYFDEARLAFIPPKPYASWVLNEETCRWDAPTPKPDDGKQYRWNEATIGWEEFSLSDAIIAP